ncbi:hypothetical protein ABIB73_000098 [Bradyrhizobium sp. F1.4.3]|uniref:hypothetical protein n=1 Tax=Bradyrhizobium sp. F1.4.3 TaxID=3156356 RepID=UPI003392600E
MATEEQQAIGNPQKVDNEPAWIAASRKAADPVAERATARTGARTTAARIPCPFAYARGKKCSGHIVGLKAFNADLVWRRGDDGIWSFSFGQPRSHYHLLCSEKGNHAGSVKGDSEQMKFHHRDLPASLQKVVSASERVA